MGLRSKFVLALAATGVALTGASGYHGYQLSQQFDLAAAHTQVQTASSYTDAVIAGKTVTVEHQKAGVEAMGNVQSGLTATMGFFAGTTLLLGAATLRERKPVLVREA